jgi:hypothetical protein
VQTTFICLGIGTKGEILEDLGVDGRIEEYLSEIIWEGVDHIHLFEDRYRKGKLGRPRRNWEGNVKMDLTIMDWEGWSGFVWLRIRT